MKLVSNFRVSRGARRLRCSVPVALRPPALAYARLYALFFAASHANTTPALASGGNTG